MKIALDLKEYYFKPKGSWPEGGRKIACNPLNLLIIIKNATLGTCGKITYGPYICLKSPRFLPYFTHILRKILPLLPASHARFLHHGPLWCLNPSYSYFADY